MIKNYLILAVKHLRKQRIFSFINILGLTVGITCCFMIFLFILNELSYDNFHKNGKDIYRVMRVGNLDGDRREIPYLSPPFGPALVNDYPDAVQQSVRVMKDNNLISYNNISFNEKDMFLTDDNFFTFFDFQLLKGDKTSVLKDPNSIVLTETAAKKYFCVKTGQKGESCVLAAKTKKVPPVYVIDLVTIFGYAGFMPSLLIVGANSETLNMQ